MLNCSTTPCNYDEGSVNSLTEKVVWLYYKYEPSLIAAQVYLPLYAIITVILIALSLYRRSWWALYTTCAGGILESVGWAGRYISAKNIVWDPSEGGQWDTDKKGFMMQIICLIIAPTFFSAANYIILGSLVRKTGSRFSSISPSSFSIMFTFTDVVCLIIQCLGGVKVGKSSLPVDMKKGLDIMAAGVIAQIVVTVVYSALLAEFIYRHSSQKPTTRQYDLMAWAKCCCSGRKDKRDDRQVQMAEVSSAEKGTFTSEDLEAIREYDLRKLVKWASTTLVLATVFIVVRSVYRCDELLGFKKDDPGVYAEESLFLALDAAFMLAVLFVYALFHHGWILCRLFGVKPSAA